MIDLTGMSVFAFAAVWGVALLVCLFVFYRFISACSSMRKANSDKKRAKAWSRIKRWAIICFLVIAPVLFMAGQESSYRPKTTIKNPAQNQINEQMQEIDNAELPVIKPAKPMSPIGEAEKMLDENKKSNEANKRAFDKLEKQQ